MSISKDFSSVITHNAFITILGAGSGFLFSLLFAKLTRLDLFGEMTLILSYSAAYYSLTILGSQSAIVRTLLNVNKDLSTFVTFLILLALIWSTSIYLLTFNKILPILGLETSLDFFCFHISFISSIVLTFPIAIFIGVFECFQNTKPVLISIFFISILRVLILILLLYIEVGLVKSILLYSIVPQIFQLAILVFYSNKLDYYNIRNVNVKNLDSSNLFFLLKYSFWFLPSTIAETFISNLPIRFIQKNGSNTEIGLFRIITLIIQSAILIPNFLSKSAIPFLTKVLNRGLDNYYKKIITILVKVSQTIMFAASILILLIVNTVLSYISADSKLTNIELLLLGATVYILSHSVIASIFISKNLPKKISFGNILSLLSIYSLLSFFERSSNQIDLPILIVMFAIFISYFISQTFLTINAILKKSLIISFPKMITEVSLILLTFTILEILSIYPIYIQAFAGLLSLSIYFAVFSFFKIFNPTEKTIINKYFYGLTK